MRNNTRETIIMRRYPEGQDGGEQIWPYLASSKWRRANMSIFGLLQIEERKYDHICSPQFGGGQIWIWRRQVQRKVQNKPAKALSNYSSLSPKYSIICSFAQYRPLATINIPYYTYKDCRSAGHGSREGGS